MLTPLLGVEGGRHSGYLLSPSPTIRDSGLEERNYFVLSDCSSDESSTVTKLNFSDSHKDKLNLKATELRLGLPGSQSPLRDGGDSELCLLSASKLDEKPLFPLTPLKDGIASFSQRGAISGSKRGFADTKEDCNRFFKPLTGHNSDAQKPVSQGKLPLNAASNVMQSSASHGPCTGPKSFAVKEQSNGALASPKEPLLSNINSAPAAKAQVVGWPPIRSFRKNNLATPLKNNEPLFVKVSMDGAPYLRKVDLRAYTTYQELSSGLEKMFSCFTLGQCGSHEVSESVSMSETKLKDILHGSENVLTYEDKDGDWMLVGDVPWEMFIDSCKRLKIMKSSDAIGLAPRSMEKSKSQM